jgi:hypothetical protein
MCWSSPKITPPPAAPQPQDAVAAGNDALKKRAGMQGYSQSILGGASGPTINATPGKTLMGGLT